MKKFIAIVVSALLLTACAHTNETVVTKNHYVAVKIKPEFLEENKCPWPAKTEIVRSDTDLELSDWSFAAYAAWTCEHKTRMKIKEESEQQAADIEKRNQSENSKPPAESTSAKAPPR